MDCCNNRLLVMWGKYEDPLFLDRKIDRQIDRHLATLNSVSMAIFVRRLYWQIMISSICHCLQILIALQFN